MILIDIYSMDQIVRSPLRLVSIVGTNLEDGLRDPTLDTLDIDMT